LGDFLGDELTAGGAGGSRARIFSANAVVSAAVRERFRSGDEEAAPADLRLPLAGDADAFFFAGDLGDFLGDFDAAFFLGDFDAAAFLGDLDAAAFLGDRLGEAEGEDDGDDLGDGLGEREAAFL